MDKAFSVSQVNRYIRSLFEADALLAELFVKGELSNFKRHGSGHLYFSLKDASASMNCVMFASYAGGLKFEPENGAEVVISGHVSLYEKTGQYQLYAVTMKPLGEGDLAAAFARLRDKLGREGLFAPEYKKPIPEWVSCVALVTSPTGAAVQDMVKVIRSRNPGVKIVVVPCLVQGEAAAADIVRAVREVNDWRGADVMLVGRGGGSAEDLQAFNDEAVARAIFASDVPVISAVGHETDVTIADFVADLRAATPSAAAVAAVGDASERIRLAANLRRRADRAAAQVCAASRAELALLSRDMERVVNSRLSAVRTKLNSRAQLLDKISPYALWKRGFAAVCDEDGRGIRSVDDLRDGQDITLHMQDGRAAARILKRSKHGADI